MVEIEFAGVKFKNAFSVRCKKTTHAQKPISGRSSFDFMEQRRLGWHRSRCQHYLLAPLKLSSQEILESQARVLHSLHAYRHILCRRSAQCAVDLDPDTVFRCQSPSHARQSTSTTLRLRRIARNAFRP